MDMNNEIIETISLLLKLNQQQLKADEITVSDTLSDTLSDDDYVKMYTKEVVGTVNHTIASVMLRLMRMAEYKGVDLNKALQARQRFNAIKDKRKLVGYKPKETPSGFVSQAIPLSKEDRPRFMHIRLDNEKGND